MVSVNAWRRGSLRVLASTSLAKTTAAAGAPPITEAKVPSNAETSRFSFNAREKTTYAPPWYREITQNTIGPLKLTTARPISAPYSSCNLRNDSGEPSKPDKLAKITTGRLLLAALMARATFFEDSGKSVPAVHWSGPSAGTNPSRGAGWDSIPMRQT